MSIIELKNITKKYRNGQVIFNDFNLSVDKGEFVGIVGQSGSGKTTLLNIIGLITEFESGEISINRQTKLKPNSRNAMLLRRNIIGYLFQNYGLVDDETVDWNLRLALEYKKLTANEKKEKVKDLLSKLGLTNYEKKRIFQLSGGEQQRVAIAKLMLQESSIVLADEPTSGLDEKNKEIVMNLLRELNNKGTTIILVTHDLTLANYFTRIIQV